MFAVPLVIFLCVIWSLSSFTRCRYRSHRNIDIDGRNWDVFLANLTKWHTWRRLAAAREYWHVHKAAPGMLRPWGSRPAVAEASFSTTALGSRSSTMPMLFWMSDFARPLVKLATTECHEFQMQTRLEPMHHPLSLDSNTIPRLAASATASSSKGRVDRPANVQLSGRNSNNCLDWIGTPCVSKMSVAHE